MNALLALTLVAAADAEVLGYIESRAYGVWGQGTELARLAPLVDFSALGLDPDEHWSIITRLRPTVKLHLNDTSTLVATAQGETRHGFFTRDFDTIDDVASMQRLYLSLTRGPVDLVAGKQLVSWGSGLLLNPTDVLNDKPVGDLAAERPGVWAALATLGLGESANLHAGAALESGECCHAVALGRFDQTLGDTDVAATVAWRERRDELTVGFDVKGELELGLWAEGAWVIELDDPRGDRVEADRGALLLEAGADYSFAVLEQLYVALEWIHQGNGVGGSWMGPVGDPPSYLTASFASGDASERRLLGSNYVLLLTRLVANTEWQAQWLNLMNLRDPSGTSVLQLTWVPAGWLELTVGAQASYGEAGSEFDLRTPNEAPLPAPLRNQRLQPAVMSWLWARAYY